MVDPTCGAHSSNKRRQEVCSDHRPINFHHDIYIYIYICMYIYIYIDLGEILGIRYFGHKSSSQWGKRHALQTLARSASPFSYQRAFLEICNSTSSKSFRNWSQTFYVIMLKKKNQWRRLKKSCLPHKPSYSKLYSWQISIFMQLRLQAEFLCNYREHKVMHLVLSLSTHLS